MAHGGRRTTRGQRRLAGRAHGGRRTTRGRNEECFVAHGSRRTTRGQRRLAGRLTAAGEQQMA